MRQKLLLLSVLVCSLAACGDGLTLTATPTELIVGGNQSAEIRAGLFVDGSAVVDAPVTFATNLGSFKASESVMSQVVNTNAQGEAVVFLFSSRTIGSAAVTAKASSGGTEYSSTILVRMVEELID